jgi:hypothetical protein
MSGVTAFLRPYHHVDPDAQLKAKDAEISRLELKVRKLTAELERYRLRAERDARHERWCKRD